MADLGEPAPEVGLGAVGVGETGVVHEGPRRHSPPGEPGHVWIGRPRHAAASSISGQLAAAGPSPSRHNASSRVRNRQDSLPLDNSTPARAIGPRAMDKNDIRSIHFSGSFPGAIIGNPWGRKPRVRNHSSMSAE
jgi:hypothetical protein